MFQLLLPGHALALVLLLLPHNVSAPAAVCGRPLALQSALVAMASPPKQIRVGPAKNDYRYELADVQGDGDRLVYRGVHAARGWDVPGGIVLYLIGNKKPVGWSRTVVHAHGTCDIEEVVSRGSPVFGSNDDILVASTFHNWDIFDEEKGGWQKRADFSFETEISST